ncbi:MAG TPA: DUF4115 domain-containing protein [Gaiellaceae bacterium]|nr:DUF4115 domain-containing protein [Gaiellaceae bacterium]
MTKVRPSDVLFWMLAMLALASVILFLLVLSGAVAIDSAATATQTTTTTKTATEAARPKTRTTSKPAAKPTTPTTKASAKPKPVAPPPPKPAQTTVVLTAARGDCWFQARVGSADGQVLDERVLTQGESISVKGKTVWLTVGAAGNLDVTVNGKPQALSAGTISVVLGAKGAAD